METMTTARIVDVAFRDRRENTMSDQVTNDQDVIDSRDVIERVAELAERYQYAANNPDADDAEPLDDDERHELDALSALIDEASDCAEDWEYGATLVRDSYFEDYARELADDLGLIPDDAAWPLRCIDWKHAASELQTDYTVVDFDGVTYWVR